MKRLEFSHLMTVLLLGVIYAALPASAQQAHGTLLHVPPPAAWQVERAADLWAATAPFEDGNVFIEIRRFEPDPGSTDPASRLAAAQDTLTDFDPHVQFHEAPADRQAATSGYSAAAVDATYVLNGRRVRSWVVTLTAQKDGVEYLWRYVAPESVFSDYLEDAERALAETLSAIGETTASTQNLPTNPKEASPASEPSKVPEADMMELAFWKSIAGSEDPGEFTTYLSRYPDGAFADLARLRLAKLQKEDGASGNLSSQAPSGSSGSPVEAGLHDCDRLAADPDDPDAVMPGPDNDLGFIENPEAAVEACARAVADFPQEPRFLTQLGNAYLHFTDDRYDPQKALDLFKKAADLGSRHALYALGMMARDGLLAEAGRHHMEEAAMWLQMAAERNHPAAMTRLALVLESGIGMPPDYDKAADYLLAAVKAGDESAFDALMVYTKSRMEGTLRAVQQRLYRAGYYNGKLDGIFGSGSKSALLSYAKDRQ